MSPATTKLQDKYRQSKTTRWYVHDDDTKTADGEAILSPSKRNVIMNKEQNQPSIDYNSEAKLDLKILLIDNHDSYTYNLYQYISTMTIHPVKVIMNDAYSSWEEFIASLGPNSTAASLDHFDCIILSPGPGKPSRPTDMGIVLETIRRNANMPILGVCLGHQALGYVYGKEVKLSPCGPVHGLMSAVSFDENENLDQSKQDIVCQLFHDLPQDFDVVRYHSLVVDFPESDDDSEIEPIAWCNGLKEKTESAIHSNEKICMALRHKRYPHYGVQFHPESIGTGEAGYQILRNFCEFAHQYKRGGNQKLEGIPSKQNGDVDTHGEFVLNGDHLMINEPESVNAFQTINNDSSTPSAYRVFIHKIDKEEHDTSSLPLPKQVFEALYGSRPNSFWLDSSTGETRSSKDDTPRSDDVSGDEGCPITSNSRFSIMGSNDGPLSRKIEYFGREHDSKQRGLRVSSKLGEEEEVMLDGDILTYLRLKLVEDREFVDKADMVTFDGSFNEKNGVDAEYTLSTIDEFSQADVQLPFDYRGGYVGYLGYEVGHDTPCRIFEKEGGFGCDAESMLNAEASASSDTTNPNIPTAAFLFVDRSLLYDHQTGDWYIIGVSQNKCELVGAEADYSAATNVGDTISWMNNMKSKIESMGQNAMAINAMKSTTKAKCEANDITFFPNRSKAQYQMDISRSHEEIRNGESYELCVTNQLEAELKLPKQSSKASHETPFELYKLLREKNPAPFSAFMSFYEEGSREMSASLSICCSSPERFLSVKKAQVTAEDNGASHDQSPSLKRQFVVESKPIKGTAARYTGSDNGLVDEPEELVKRLDSEIAQKLKESVKDRAENLMIVDLLRNDLGRVCQVGSVHVPKLMHIESFATVHQMVSTVRGMLDGDTTHAIDVIEACFPGGSMTGAPKQRTMEILDEIEQGVSRGPYSGCLGYISLNGCMDMNIVIRSAVLTPSDNNSADGETDDNMETWKASIGCGGAITALSDSDDEYEEMLLKSRVVRRTISDWVAESTAEHTQQHEAD